MGQPRGCAAGLAPETTHGRLQDNFKCNKDQGVCVGLIEVTQTLRWFKTWEVSVFSSFQPESKVGYYLLEILKYKGGDFMQALKLSF